MYQIVPFTSIEYFLQSRPACSLTCSGSQDSYSFNSHMISLVDLYYED